MAEYGGDPQGSRDITCAEVLSDFTVHLKPNEVPEDVLHAAKLHLLDALGCGIAAHASQEQVAAQYVALNHAPDGPCPVIGAGRTVDTLSSAFTNAALIQAMDYDDTHASAVCHVSSVIVPAVLAAAIDQSSTGSQALTAIVIGIEITARLGMLSCGSLMKSGLHPTSIFGVFGAAAAASALIGLDDHQTTDALGIAGSHSSGVMACLAEGVPVKPLHAANAARAGVLCAELAQAGATGPRAILEGHNGLLPALTGESQRTGLFDQLVDLGSRWETPHTAFKAWPVCHFIQGALQAASEITVNPEEIATIEALIDRSGVPLVIEPLAEKTHPKSTYQARFSLPYCLSVMLASGSLDVKNLLGSAGDPQIQRLSSTFRYSSLDPDPSRSQFAGQVIVHTTTGQSLSARVDHPLGTAQQPMSEDQVLAKYRANAALSFSQHQLTEIEELVLNLDSPSTSLAPIGNLLTSAAP